MNIKDIRKLKIADLEKKVDDLTKDLEKLHFEITNGKEKNTAKFKFAKRDLAKVKTVLNELKLIKEEKAK